MPTKVIILSGSMGCGKTTVLGEASDVLSTHYIAHACVDLDAIGTVLIPEDVAADLVRRNLAGIYANFVSAGLSHVLLAEAVENRRDLDNLRGAMPEAEIVVCRLTAAFATMESRLRVREPGMNQAKLLARARELQQVLDAAQVEDFTVVNDDRSVTAIAHEVLERAGWLACSADRSGLNSDRG
jgi:gluconate kinase